MFIRVEDRFTSGEFALINATHILNIRPDLDYRGCYLVVMLAKESSTGCGVHAPPVVREASFRISPRQLEKLAGMPAPFGEPWGPAVPEAETPTTRESAVAETAPPKSAAAQDLAQLLGSS